MLSIPNMIDFVDIYLRLQQIAWLARYTQN